MNMEAMIAAAIIKQTAKMHKEHSIQVVPVLAAVDRLTGTTEFTDALAEIHAMSMICAVSTVGLDGNVFVDYGRVRTILEAAIVVTSDLEVGFKANHDAATQQAGDAIKKASSV